MCIRDSLEGAALGDPRIVVHPVTAEHETSRLRGGGPPLRLRAVGRAEIGWSPRSKPPVAVWREHVFRDVAHDIKRMLRSGAEWEESAGQWRPVVPGDVAVLAAKRHELEAIQAALADIGVPSVVNAGGSVFHTPAATEWLVSLIHI